MKHDCTQLDAAIIDAITTAPQAFVTLSTALNEAAKPFVQDPRNPKAPPAPAFRVIDRRLQALRKRGIITYSRGDLRWHLAKA